MSQPFDVDASSARPAIAAGITGVAIIAFASTFSKTLFDGAVAF